MKSKDAIRAEEFRNSIVGVVSGIYYRQKRNSRKRGHTPPSYSRVELDEWMHNNGYKELYDTWISSGMDTSLKPSVDRLIDSIGYSFDNIQLVTWKQNQEKNYKERKNGTNSQINKRVGQFSKDGILIESFHSIKEAERVTGINNNCIGRVCRNKGKLAGGFKWSYQ